MRIISWIFGIGLTLIGIIWYFFYTPVRPDVPTIRPLPIWTPISTGSDDMRKVWEKNEKTIAQNKKNISDILHQAIETRDDILCDSIQDINSQEMCHDEIIFVKSWILWDVELCGKITTPSVKNKCFDAFFSQEALKKQDATFCEKLSSETQKVSCLEHIRLALADKAIESGNITKETCNTLSDDKRDYCLKQSNQIHDPEIYNLAITDKNLESCKKIENQELQTSCHDVLVHQRAIEEKSGAVCNDIIQEDKKSACNLQLSSFQESQDFQSILSLWDISKCNTMNDELLQIKCFDILTLRRSLKERDITWCNSIHDTEMKQQCNITLQNN